MKFRIEGIQSGFGRRFENVQWTGTGQSEPKIGILLILNIIVPFFQYTMHVMQCGDGLHVLVITDGHIRFNQ